MSRPVKLTSQNIAQHLEAEHGIAFESVVAEIERQLQYDKRINQASLARHFGVSRQTVIRWLPLIQSNLPAKLI